MKKKLDLSTIMSMIHLVFFLSICCFGTMYLTVSILTIPSLTAAFVIGKDVIFKRFDVNDDLVKRFFSELMANMRMMKYFPIQLLIFLQAAGIYASEKTGMTGLVYPMVACISFCAALIVYAAACRVFVETPMSITEIIITMLYRVQYFLIIWVLMILCVLFFGTVMLEIFFFAGALLLMAIETVAFLDILAFKKASDKLTEEEMNCFGEDFIKSI